MTAKDIDRLCARALDLQRPVMAAAIASATPLDWVEPPRPQGSFGLAGDWVEVTGTVPRAVTLLAIPFDPKQLGWISRESLRVFRFDRRKPRFHALSEARHHATLPVVFAPIDAPGVYGLIGLHTHPVVQDAIRMFCRQAASARRLPVDRQHRLRDRICEVSLCAPDMEPLFTSRAALEPLAVERGIELPAELPPPLSRPRHPGETVCERCHGIDVLDFPDCHVLEPQPDRPCRQATWENVGPTHISGAMRQVLVDPTDRRRLYAAAANGGVWRLDDIGQYPAGQVWRPLTDALPNIRFRAVAVASSDGTVVYAANSVKRLRTTPLRVFSEIYRSDDWGSTWEAVHGAGMGVVHRLVVHPAHVGIVFAATSTGLWRQSATTPGTWTRLRQADCLDVALDPNDSSIVYLGVRAVGILKSFTSGDEWMTDPILAFDAAAAGNREAIRIALGVRNTDQTFQTPTTRTVVVRFGNEICVSGTSGEGPAAWTRTVPTRIVPNDDPPPATIDAALHDLDGGVIRRSDTLPRHASEWANALAVDPFNPDHILAGSVTMLDSADGGVTWRALSLPHEDEQCVVFDREQAGVTYLANDGGLFSSVDGGATWPNMGLGATSPRPNRGLNLARGLITSELDRSVVRAGRCVAVIDHTGFVLSEDFAVRWQFLFNAPDGSARHAHENGFVYACPASLDRYYVINMRAGDDPTEVTGRLAQLDFTRTGGLVDPPAFTFLSTMRAALPGDNGDFKPEDMIYLENLPGPFAAQFIAARSERLLLFGTANQPALGGFTIQSLRMAASGTAATALTEAISPEPFFALTFVPAEPDRAFAITRGGALFERNLAAPGQFTAVAAFAIGATDLFVSRLVAAPRGGLRLFALTQHSVRRFVVGSSAWTAPFVWPDENETLLSLAVHPTRDDTLFLGTSRGVYSSEDDGSTWRSYRGTLPPVAVTELSFDQGFLYAATFGRGLWRCRPCA